MPTIPSFRRALSVAASLVLVAGLGATAAQAAPTNPDAVRTDRVRTTLDWAECPPLPGIDGEPVANPNLRCAMVDLPLDYDDPTGPQVQVFAVKHLATDPANRVGTLFTNPGGPGGPGSILGIAAADYFSPEVVAKFDIVGFEPRGIGNSTLVYCGDSAKKQMQEWRGFAKAIPLTQNEKSAYLNSSKQQAMGCSTTGAPISASMSTAEVARDMDVMRRLSGDEKLSYIGLSYGTYLGQVYANMFPDRVRAVVIDGVLDPLGWAGTPATANDPVTLRIKSGEGAWKALQASFDACEAAGPGRCMNAPDPRGTFDRLVAQLKAAPIQIQDPEMGSITFTYGDFIGTLLQVMYAPTAPDLVDQVLAMVGYFADPGVPAAQKFQAKQRLDATVAAAKEKLPPNTMDGYFQGQDPFWSVLCTDSLNPVAPKAWEPAIAAREADAPHFAALWGWQSAVCANRFWKATDEDAWRGPFNNHTSAPVLSVGNYYDPATNYDGAVAAAAVLPNSGLLSVDSFGHCAYGNNACATKAMDEYLLTGVLPTTTTCASEYQPFTQPAGPGLEG